MNALRSSARDADPPQEASLVAVELASFGGGVEPPHAARKNVTSKGLEPRSLCIDGHSQIMTLGARKKQQHCFFCVDFHGGAA